MATHSSILAWRILWMEELGGIQSTGRKELDTTERLPLSSSASLHHSLRKTFFSLLAILWNSAFKQIHLSFSPLPLASLLFSAICKASSDNHFALLHFFFLGMVLIPLSCTMSQTSIHSSSGTVTLRSNSLNLFVTSTVRDLIQVIPEQSSGFPYFLQFKSEFGNKKFMI